MPTKKPTAYMAGASLEIEVTGGLNLKAVQAAISAGVYWAQFPGGGLRLTQKPMVWRVQPWRVQPPLLCPPPAPKPSIRSLVACVKELEEERGPSKAKAKRVRKAAPKAPTSNPATALGHE